MSKSRETFNKREKEKKRLEHRQEKLEKMQERRNHEKRNKSLDEMLAYVDENGNLTTTPPDTKNVSGFSRESRNSSATR